jgi:hypothetical protein
MLKTLWTVTAAGLLALCVTGCGGGSDAGSDYASKLCEKAKACGSTTDVATCKAETSQTLSQIPSSQRDSIYRTLDQCLAVTDCSAAHACVLAIDFTGGSSVVSEICDKLKSCDSTTDVAVCKTEASQTLASVPSTQKDAVYKILDQCIAGSCATLQSCVADVQSQVVDYYVTQICDKLKSCDSTTDVSQCQSQAGQNLALVPSSVKDDLNKMLDQCLAQTGCSVFQSCIGNVQSLVGG